MNMSTFGLRDLIILAIAVASIYLVYLLLALLRLRRGRQLADATLWPESSLFGGAGQDSDVASFRGMPREEPQFFPPAQTPSTPAPRPAAVDNKLAAAGNFSSELARSAAESEIRQLRHEVTQLRTSMLQLTEEMRQLKTARNISPLYNQAMALAQQGASAEGIAERYGISLGEAELVVALAHSEHSLQTQREPR